MVREPSKGCVFVRRTLLVACGCLGLLPAQQIRPADSGGRDDRNDTRHGVLVEYGEALGAGGFAPPLTPDDPALTDRLESAWIAQKHEEVERIAGAMLGKDPMDFRGYALQYLAQLELKRDRRQATKVAVNAIKALGRHPRAMAEFILSALLVNPTLNEYQMSLMAIVPLVPDNKSVAVVRSAHLCALLGCGKRREAVIVHRGVVADLRKASATDLLTLVERICDSPGGEEMSAVARGVLGEAMKRAKVDVSRARMLRYRVLHELEKNVAAARKLGAKIVAEGGDGSSLNLWMWQLMVRRATRGRYRTLALLAARKLLTQNPSGYGKDTAALGLFKNGFFEEALERQEQSIRESAEGTVTEGMRRRLRIFRKVVAERRVQRRSPRRDR